MPDNRRKAVAIRHVQFEDLGTFAPVLAKSGYDIAYVDVGIDDVKSIARQTVHLLVVLGGPIGAYENDLYPFLNDEIEIIRQRVSSNRPTLGICLGAQLMAAALGARVVPGPAKEIGWAPLKLTQEGRGGPLGHLAQNAVLHWHGDTFDLPNGAVRLASTDICVNQAFSIEDFAMALQFHAEADIRMFERWLIGHAVEIAAAGLSVCELRADAQRFGPPLAQAGQACIAQWLSQLRPP